METNPCVEVNFQDAVQLDQGKDKTLMIELLVIYIANVFDAWRDGFLKHKNEDNSRDFHVIKTISFFVPLLYISYIWLTRYRGINNVLLFAGFALICRYSWKAVYAWSRKYYDAKQKGNVMKLSETWKAVVKSLLAALVPIIYVMVKERNPDFPLDVDQVVSTILWAFTALTVGWQSKKFFLNKGK